jgi:uncharacterized caspase-like protein
MLRRILSGFAVMATLLYFVLPASAQQRIALVIGNAAYPKGAIGTSLADGGLVAEALTSIGFEIVEGADVNQADMRRLVRDFLAKVQAAGPDAIAFVYYSGYGLEFEGDNYLIPVDARLERDSDIPIEAIRLFDLLRPLADTQAAAKIVILDATRPLPFQIQGGKLARGLGAIEAAPGLIVGFSSAPGTAVPDGPGPYGAYATAIAEMVREPGLNLEALFASIRVRTAEATSGAQVPWNVSQGINPQIMLVPGAPNAAQGAPQAIVGGPPPRPIRDVGPEQAYAYAIESDNLDTYTEYVRAYPDSPYTQRVWGILRDRREALAWRRALAINTPEAYWTYLSRYPDGMYAFDAERRLRRLSAGLRPPSGFRAMEFEDVPPPLDGEPTRFIDVYPAAPPPMRRLRPPPAFIVGLPPPQRQPGLWRRPNNVMPVIIAPNGAPRIISPGGPQFQKKGPTVVTTPPPGAPVVRGAPPNDFRKQGTTTTNPPSGEPKFKKKGPQTNTTTTITTTPPPRNPPKTKAPVIVNNPPSNNPSPTLRGGPPPSTSQQQQFKKVEPPKAPVVRAPPPPPPPPPPRPPVVSAPPPGPPPQARGAPPPGPPPGQKKCVVVDGKQQCK